MILASHVIFGAYGFWLPNDPRGSWSEFVGSWDLFRFGRATKTTETKSMAARPHDRSLRLQAKESLNFPPVNFSDFQVHAIAKGFENYSHRSNVTIFARAIMQDHVHLVIAAHRLAVESLVIQLKGAASKQLITEKLHPFCESDGKRPKCFARGEWKVFLNTTEAIVRAIEYVENNPVKDGKPKQTWPFVKTYV